jgi:hypothetical protein
MKEGRGQRGGNTVNAEQRTHLATDLGMGRATDCTDLGMERATDFTDSEWNEPQISQIRNGTSHRLHRLAQTREEDDATNPELRTPDKRQFLPSL